MDLTPEEEVAAHDLTTLMCEQATHEGLQGLVVTTLFRVLARALIYNGRIPTQKHGPWASLQRECEELRRKVPTPTEIRALWYVIDCCEVPLPSAEYALRVLVSRNTATENEKDTAPGIVSQGAALISAERERQIVEGYDAKHDDVCGIDYGSGSPLIQAAVAYANHAANPDAAPMYWPWDNELWKPKDPIRDLVRAGALIAAEIDRRLRARSAGSAERTTSNPTTPGRIEGEQ